MKIEKRVPIEARTTESLPLKFTRKMIKIRKSSIMQVIILET